MSTIATPEEWQRVRRTECLMNGHSWKVIETLHSLPQAIVCTNCGEHVRFGDRTGTPTTLP